MSNKILQTLGSYDLFGKSVPGALLLFGLWSALPNSILDVDGTGKGSLASVVALLLLLLLAGLMIGQGLHTFADNTEKLFRWILSRLFEAALILKIQFNINYEFSTYISNKEKDREKTPTAKFKQDWKNGAVVWFRRRFWGLFDSFAGHRFLFSKWFQWNYHPDDREIFDSRWEMNKMDEKMDPFSDRFDSEFENMFKDKSIRNAERENVEKVYPLVVSYLEDKGVQTHRKFQATYSFCRSMWVVLLILTFVYAIAIYQPIGDLNILTSDPRFAILPQAVVRSLPALTLLGSLLFIDAAGTYKSHYVEYLLAAFANAQQNCIDDPEQKTLREF